MRDIHTSIPISEERAVWLGIHLRGTDAGVRVAWIDPKLAPQIPLVIGDEITTFDGKPIGEVVNDIALVDGLNSTPEFTKTFAEWFLTLRSTSDLLRVPHPNDHAKLGIRRNGALSSAELPWLDINVIEPSERCPYWPKSRKSLIPPLGRVLWQSDPSVRFEAYAFEAAPLGARYGFVRLQTYDLSNDEQTKAIRDFNVAIDAFLANNVSAIVLDQRGNGGGNFLFAYVMLARLFDRPLIPTQQRYLVRTNANHDRDEVIGLGPRADLQAITERLDMAHTDAEAATVMNATPVLADHFAFGPRDLKAARDVMSFFRFFADKPDGLTAPHFILVPEIAPDTTHGPAFTKPVLMLIDETDISAADYVAATLKDNHRATLFGTTTSGAGGDQRHVGLNDACTPETLHRLFVPCAPPPVIDALKSLGFSGFNYTVTLGVRPNDHVIENVGINPDIPYRISAEDITTSFAPMRAEILRALQKISANATAMGK